MILKRHHPFELTSWWGLVVEWFFRNLGETVDNLHMNALRGPKHDYATNDHICVACGESFSRVLVESPDLCGPCALLAQVFAGTLFKPKDGSRLFKPIPWDTG